MSQGAGSPGRHRRIAELGQQALRTGDPGTVLKEACQTAAELLGVDRTLLVEAGPADNEAIPHAGAGWPGVPSSTARLPAGEDSLTRKALNEGEPARVDEGRLGERFEATLEAGDRDLRSGISVPVGRADDPWGTLEVYSAEPRFFDEEDVYLLQNVANILACQLAPLEGRARPASAEDRGVFEEDPVEVLGRVTDAFYALDDAFRFTHVNDPAAEILQANPEELLGENLWEAYPEAAEIDEVWDAFHVAMENQETTGYELYYRPLDVWVDTTIYPSETGVSVYFRDVTERKERERKLRESEARFRTLAENLDEVIWMSTEDPGDIVYLNPKFEAVWGLSRVEVYQDASKFLGAIHPDDRDRVEEAYFGLPDTDYDVEYRVTRPDGSTRWLHAHAVAVRDESGSVHRIVGIADDITEHRDRERRLRQEKDKFEAIVSEVEEYALFMLDPDGHVQSWNVGAEQITGYAEDEILGEHVSTFYRSEDRRAGRPQQNLERAIQGGSLQEEGVRLRKDGSTFWANVTMTPLWEDGSLRGFSKVVRDMTRRREQERAIEESERRHRTLVENFPNGAVGLFDEDLRYTLVGGRILDELGEDPDDIIGQTVQERYPEPLARKLAPRFEAVFRGESHSFEMTFRGLDWTVNTIPIRGPDGEVISGLVVVQDITDRKQMERDLRESRELYRTLIEQFPNGAVVLVDHDLRFVIAGGSPVTADVGTASSMEGKRVHDVFPENVVREVVPRYEAALKGGSDRFELQHDGRHAQIHIFPMRDEHGHVRYAMGMSQDVTERREYQHRLEESNKHLEQFAYAASHDLQEPLRMTSAYLQMIENRYGDSFDEEGRVFFEYAIDGAQRMRDMIQSLLQYARVARAEPSFERTDANEILEDVLRDLQLRIAETDAEIKIEELPRVRADPNQLGQVFRNLIANALEYSGDQAPRVRVSADRTPFRWRFSVEDEGIGIPEPYREKIFEVFEQIPQEGATKKGTGVGLAICQRIVERHGGRIWVESEPGEGTTFSFTLPVLDQEPQGYTPG